ncbi:MAG: 2-phosphosulfolactate phosphatase [Burkholderiales bacterium]|nr:2-phosphosulfolactate phosphatase [Burkholderiales bacterium]
MMPLASKVHVLFRKEELDGMRLQGKVVVVLDILFATSTIVNAMAHGATEVIPTMDEKSARAVAATLPEGSFVASGELYAETLPGFAPPTPLALLEHDIAGRKLVYSTTNGTVALQLSKDADHVYAGALLNGKALVRHICEHHPRETVLVVCSGSMGNANLEDMVGAGFFADLFARQLGDNRDFSDAAQASMRLFRGGDALEMLMAARVGRMMQDRGLTHEVEYAARQAVLEVVPRLEAGRLVVAT